LAATLAATATARPGKRLAHYCSTSGDLCYGVRKSSGAFLFDIDTFARYFARYRLCLRPPGRAATCKTFAIHRRGRIFGSTIRFASAFKSSGPGRYRVEWKLGGRRLGPALSFRLRR
jgi:hypothetical protein